MRISDWSSDVCSSDLEHGNSCLVVDDVRLIVHMIELDAKRCRIRQTGFNATTEANAIAPGAADTRRADLVALIADAAIHASAVIDRQARAAADAPTPLGFDAQRICGDRKSTRLNSSH